MITPLFAVIALALLIGVPTTVFYHLLSERPGVPEDQVEPAIEEAFMDGFDYARRELK